MKRLTIFFVFSFIQFSIAAQEVASNYPFHVEVTGAGTPVLLIPGLACPGAVWDATVATLQDKYECHVLSLAGFAGQEAINLDQGFLPVIEEQLIAYIDQEIKKPTRIIGHSLGGFLGLSIASKIPNQIEQLVIVDSYPFYSAAMIPGATEETAKPQAELMKNMLGNMADDRFEQQQKQTMASMVTHPDQIAQAVQWSIQSDRSTVAQAMYEIMITDLREEVKQVECPILVFGSWISGKDYGITKTTVEQNYKSQFAAAKYYSIKVADQAKHFIMWDEADWFHNELKAFLK